MNSESKGVVKGWEEEPSEDGPPPERLAGASANPALSEAPTPQFGSSGALRQEPNALDGNSKPPGFGGGVAASPFLAADRVGKASSLAGLPVPKEDDERALSEEGYKTPERSERGPSTPQRDSEEAGPKEHGSPGIQRIRAAEDEDPLEHDPQESPRFGLERTLKEAEKTDAQPSNAGSVEDAQPSNADEVAAASSGGAAGQLKLPPVAERSEYSDTAFDEELRDLRKRRQALSVGFANTEGGVYHGLTPERKPHSVFESLDLTPRVYNGDDSDSDDEYRGDDDMASGSASSSSPAGRKHARSTDQQGPTLLRQMERKGNAPGKTPPHPNPRMSPLAEAAAAGGQDDDIGACCGRCGNCGGRNGDQSKTDQSCVVQ
jgi:hypothetical protein